MTRQEILNAIRNTPTLPAGHTIVARYATGDELFFHNRAAATIGILERRTDILPMLGSVLILDAKNNTVRTIVQ